MQNKPQVTRRKLLKAGLGAGAAVEAFGARPFSGSAPAAGAAGAGEGDSAGAASGPNIVLIVADDLGWCELGSYGQKKIKTPHLDRLAQQGMRLTRHYSGSPVCAPSRCVLMTGKHPGHAFIRNNKEVKPEGQHPIPAAEVTLAELLKRRGYACGAFGKWGLGEPGTTGIPNRQGFDTFFGYLNQGHAHNYYPDYLWRNEEKVALPNEVAKGVATKRVTYSHDLFAAEAVDFVERNKERPFFLYLALTIPHANNEAGWRKGKAGETGDAKAAPDALGRATGDGMEVPSDEPYSGEPWPQVEKNFAAMVTRMDRDVGRLMARLKELGLDEDTIVFFTSDNGPHREGGHDPNFFDDNGPLRGIKRDLYEGGIRVPMIVRWPGQVKAGSVSDQVWAFWDFLPTAAELAGAEPPEGIDGISMRPALTGRPQKDHAYLYWEFHEGGFHQAVRMGDWKGVRHGLEGKVEVYDLRGDVGEKRNVAGEQDAVAGKMEEILGVCRTDSPHFRVREKR